MYKTNCLSEYFLSVDVIVEVLTNDRAYWNHIHPSFPVIHRETFLFQLNKDRKKVPRMGRSALDQLERRIPQVLLLSMFALSARFVESYEPREDSDPGDAYATRAESLIAQHSTVFFPQDT